MKPALIFALGIASTAAVISAHAQTYQWKDSSGHTVISDTPPPGNARDARKLGGGAPITTGSTASKPPEAPKSFAEKDMEFKKRQLESSEKADKEAKEKAAANDKKENCERAKRQLTVLESGQRVANVDANGERRFMEDAERQQEIERTRKYVADACK